MLALSVSTSQRTDPAANAEPSATFHFAIVPSLIVGERAIMRSCSAMLFLPIEGAQDRRLYFRGRWLGRQLEGVVVGHRHVLARYEGDGRVEGVEAPAGDEVGDVRAHARDRPRLVDDDA